ncbi:DUF4333 domain-containing protein [Gordonia sp. (in: high G+C Gram-positive bacteria)]|uniref:DUF4333 domain-containing protein n=1 Tax=Gordonia sp. (in: high G+C Gram-positive bacteria) TaxID=84139 RepID=UPI0039E45FBE
MTEPQKPESDATTDPSEEVTQAVESPAAPQQQYQYPVPGTAASPQFPAAPQPGYPVPPGAVPPTAAQPGQPVQPGQPGQPFGQPGQYPQQGQPPFAGQPYPGAPGAPSGGSSGALKALLFSGIGLVVLVGLLAVTAFLWPGWAPRTLSESGAEKGVAKILTSDYQVQNVSNVSCPSGQKVKKGESFTCTVSIDGRRQRVTVTFLDSKGGFEVGAPS